MPALGSVVTSLELIDSISAGTELFRARVRSAADLWPLDANNLGPPPSRIVAAGRMNPPGISYLYLALDNATAAAEIVRNPPVTFAVACFEATRELRILNLVDLPNLPSIFEETRLQDREFILFLHGFIYAISRPVKKDGSEHVEYIPSQVVCEYFASVFRHEEPLDGILYPSAIRKGGKNLVLFPRGNSENEFQQVAFLRSWEESAEDWSELANILSIT